DAQEKRQPWLPFV
uniref:Peroniin-1.3a n=1 Tax=Litoria peronii TaxID=317363 RepID=PE13A_LITPE|nr:RecName: Full=Peroniin-1.3a [Litoria peronii]